MKISAIGFLLYYGFAIFCLPMGDFSVLPSLPEMYHQCQSHEDKDMNIIDFVTDHLINIDGLFDAHDQGDEQLPHQSNALQHHSNGLIYCHSNALHCIFVNPFYQKNALDLELTFLPNRYNSKLFRPPINLLT